MTAELRQKISAHDLAVMLIEECVDAQHVRPLREDLSEREAARFVSAVRRYQLAGLLMALNAASRNQGSFRRVKELVDAAEFQGKPVGEAPQLRGDVVATIASLQTLFEPRHGNAQFTWARVWYQDIGVDEANPAVLGHLAMQWLDFYVTVQKAVQQFDPQVELEPTRVKRPTASPGPTNRTEPDAREAVCMRLAVEARADMLRCRLQEPSALPERSFLFAARHPIFSLRQRRQKRHDRQWLTERIAAIESEVLPKAPKEKTLNALWDGCGLRDVAMSLDASASLISAWVGILYGDDIARRTDVVARALKIATEQEQEAAAADQEGYNWDFASPIESLLYQLDKELPEYR